MADSSFGMSGIKLGLAVEGGMKRTFVTRAASAPLTIHTKTSEAAIALEKYANQNPRLASLSRSRQKQKQENSNHSFFNQTAGTTTSLGVGRQNLSSASVVSSFRNQQEAKESMRNIVRRSNSPGVVRLYSASIKQDPKDHSLFSPETTYAASVFAKQRRRRMQSDGSGVSASQDPNLRDIQAYRKSRGGGAVDAAKSRQWIMAMVAGSKEDTAKVHVPLRAASKLVIDNRPKPPGILPSFQKRISMTGALAPEVLEVLPFPRNPFATSTTRCQPEDVYPPKNINQTLEKCQPGRIHNASNVTEAEKYAQGFIEQKRNPEEEEEENNDLPPTSSRMASSPARSPGRSPRRRKRFGSPDGDEAAQIRSLRMPPPPEVQSALASSASVPVSIAPPYSKGAEQAMRDSHKDQIAPTRSTLASRERIVKLKAHLQFRMNIERGEAEGGDANLSTSLRSGLTFPPGMTGMASTQSSDSVSIGGGGNTPRRIATPNSGRGMRGRHDLPLGVDRLVAEHRGLVVKAVHNQ